MGLSRNFPMLRPSDIRPTSDHPHVKIPSQNPRPGNLAKVKGCMQVVLLADLCLVPIPSVVRRLDGYRWKGESHKIDRSKLYDTGTPG